MRLGNNIRVEVRNDGENQRLLKDQGNRLLGGIDISIFSAQFLASTIFLIIALILSVAAVFFKQPKESIA